MTDDTGTDETRPLEKAKDVDRPPLHQGFWFIEALLLAIVIESVSRELIVELTFDGIGTEGQLFLVVFLSIIILYSIELYIAKVFISERGGKYHEYQILSYVLGICSIFPFIYVAEIYREFGAGPELVSGVYIGIAAIFFVFILIRLVDYRGESKVEPPKLFPNHFPFESKSHEAGIGYGVICAVVVGFWAAKFTLPLWLLSLSLLALIVVYYVYWYVL